MRRVSFGILAVMALVALLADCLAGERPILSSVADEMHVLECPEVAGNKRCGEELSALLDSKSWALWPPIRFAPEAVRSRAGRLAVLEAPSSEHWLGTDDRGRDVASRLIHGTRLSLGLAVACALMATLLGCLLALIGSLWPVTDRALVGLYDVIAALPVLLVALVLQGLSGARGWTALLLLISIPRAASTARLVRAGLQEALEQPYCDAARAVGCSPLRVLVRHALPQLGQQLWVAAALTAGTSVLAEVALSFLGLGVPDRASWGELLRQAHENGLVYWLLWPSGLASFLLVWALGRWAQDNSTDRRGS